MLAYYMNSIFKGIFTVVCIVQSSCCCYLILLTSNGTWLLYLAIKLIAVPISSAKQQQQANIDSGLPRAIRLNTTSQQVVSASPVVSVLLMAYRLKYLMFSIAVLFTVLCWSELVYYCHYSTAPGHSCKQFK